MRALLVVVVTLLACTPVRTPTIAPSSPYVVVLGTAQDGGDPQAGTPPGPAWNPSRRRLAASIAIVDPRSGNRWLIEATPDFRDQLRLLDSVAPANGVPGLQGIFVTHAHVGHYAGLIHLGREVIGARGVPVYAMPRMRRFLESNGPWEQLVRLRNVEMRELSAGVGARIAEDIVVTPFLVPHRDEYSETVGFRIQGPNRTVVFLPDIDKWERWDSLGVRVEDVVASADVAYLDGTFFRADEVPGRAMSEIPHPLISETMQRFSGAPEAQRRRIRFIHLNRTNGAAASGSVERREIERAGFAVARPMERSSL